MPYTGKFAQYGVNGRAEAAYFRMINDRGGINGRRINFISLDSTSDTAKRCPWRSSSSSRNRCLLTVGIWGTPTNLAVRSYLNEKKVPQLFVAGARTLLQRSRAISLDYGVSGDEARSRGKTTRATSSAVKPTARIAILYADDPSGKEWLLGVHDVLGDKAAAMIVKEVSFVYSDRRRSPPKSTR